MACFFESVGRVAKYFAFKISQDDFVIVYTFNVIRIDWDFPSALGGVYYILGNRVTSRMPPQSLYDFYPFLDIYFEVAAACNRV